MKIPLLAALALLAFVEANGVNAETDERRLAYSRWYPDKDNKEGEKHCGWKVFEDNGKCYQQYYCYNYGTKNYDKVESVNNGQIPDQYCEKEKKSSDEKEKKSKKCKKWKNKCRECKRGKEFSNSQVSTCMHIVSLSMF